MEQKLEIDGWGRNIRFSACHVLLHHDKCSRIHGHSYAIHVRITGVQDENNLLYDFGIVKSTLKKYARELDHRALIPTENGDIRYNVDEKKGVVTLDMSGKIYVFPITDVAFIPVSSTTVEELSRYILERLVNEIDFPRGITAISLGIDEGPGQGAWASVELNKWK
jgi:6-pyruvoyltetrahydropterin/6-carboxytetrahydropterin synthase